MASDIGSGIAASLTRVDHWLTLVADSSAGNVGGMVMAGVFLLALGLAGVAIWRMEFTSLLAAVPMFSTGGESATEQSQPTADAESQSGEATAGDPSPVEPEPQSDSDVILDILESHEGRMKQANIVDETGWSKSKVSMLLSEMEENGAISKLRVGRENIISLSGNEPEAAGSPFDDE